jgi:hypothetical protein
MDEETSAEATVGSGRVTNYSSNYLLTIANAIRGTANTPWNLGTQWISLHSDDPGPTGANELTGGGYARKAVTWGAPTIDTESGDARGKIAGTPITFDVPAGRIEYYGVWNVATGAGTPATNGFMYGKELSVVITLAQVGKITVTPTHLYGIL